MWPLIKDTVTEWLNDDPFRLGAALAYYTVFSLAPLLVILVAVVGFVWGNQTDMVRTEVLNEVHGLLGDSGAELFGTMLESTSRPGSGGTVATVIGIAALLFGATTVFGQLQAALNTIWEVEGPSGWKSLIMTRLLSFGIILLVGVLLVTLLVASALLPLLDQVLEGITPQTELLIRLIELAVSFGILTLLFAMIYKFLPDVWIDWRDVWMGAALTAALFTLGKFVLGAYLGTASPGSAYGAAGSLAMLLVWIYYSSIILFFGAEFTQVYARRYGSRIRPAHNAARLPDTPAADETESAPVAPVRSPSGAPRWKRWSLLALAFLLGRFSRRREP